MLAKVKRMRYNTTCRLQRRAQAAVAQLVAHIIGSDEVTGSIPVSSSWSIRKSLKERISGFFMMLVVSALAPGMPRHVFSYVIIF